MRVKSPKILSFSLLSYRFFLFFLFLLKSKNPLTLKRSW
nr:MAG TPA: hypothetical protein [Caudoviricetes sp.]